MGGASSASLASPGASRGPVFRVFIVLLTVIVLFPIYWILVTALKTPLENISPVPTLFPKIITFENFRAVVNGGVLRNFGISLFVASASTGVSLVLAFSASYALVRFRFPFRLNVIFLIWILVVKILPPMVLAVPLYTLFAGAGLINKLWGLVAVNQVYTLPYCIWLLFGFIKSMPLEFEQAAQIDGASRMRTLTAVVLPLASSGIIAAAIFTIIIVWDEFLFALLFIRSPKLQTLPLKIVSFITEYETLWGELMAVGLLAALPVLLFTGYCCRRLTEGVAMGLK